MKIDEKRTDYSYIITNWCDIRTIDSHINKLPPMLKDR
jgi:hypothetical protein